MDEQEHLKYPWSSNLLSTMVENLMEVTTI